MSERLFRQRVRAAAIRAWPSVSVRVVLLTSQSRWTDSRLTSAQHAFLDPLARGSVDLVRSHLPFDAEAAPGASETLAIASWRNARQWVWIHRDPAYARDVAACLAPLLASARDGVLLVTGSAGLALLSVTWPHLQITAPLAIVALGPAGRAPPHADLAVVQGARDGWSRRLYKGPVHHRPTCGHLGYWTDPLARRVAVEALSRLMGAPA